MVRGFGKQVKAIERAIGGPDTDKEAKAITKLKKQVLQEQLKQLKRKKVQAQVQKVRGSILSKQGTVNEVPRKQLTFLGRI